MTDAFVDFRRALKANLEGILGRLVPPDTGLDGREGSSRAPVAANGPERPLVQGGERRADGPPENIAADG